MGKRTGSHVVPVWVVRSQFLVRTGLDSVDPVGDLRYGNNSFKISYHVLPEE